MDLAELSDFLRWLEAIHDGHVAVHQDQEVVSSLLPTGAWVPQPFLLPLLGLFKSKNSVECTIGLKSSAFELVFNYGFGGHEIEDVVINHEYLRPILAWTIICCLLNITIAFLLFFILLLNLRIIHEFIIPWVFSQLMGRSLNGLREVSLPTAIWN